MPLIIPNHISIKCHQFLIKRWLLPTPQIQGGKWLQIIYGMFLEVVPSFSSMVFRCGEGYILEACSTSAAAAAAGPAAELALFLPESRRDVKPQGSMFLEVVPSFSSMVFRCGEGCVLEACSMSSSSTTTTSSSSRSTSCTRFVLNRIQKGRQASGQHVFGSRSILQ